MSEVSSSVELFPAIDHAPVSSNSEWEIMVAERTHQETLHHALGATILPLLNPRLSHTTLEINPYECRLARQLAAGQPPHIVSLMDLDGSVFPYPFTPYLSADARRTDFRAGYRFIHEVTRASAVAEIFTGRIPVADTPPLGVPEELWALLTRHFPLIRPRHEERIAHLGDFKLEDNWVSKLHVQSGKTSADPVANFLELVNNLSSPPDLVYYFGDADIDRTMSRQIRQSCQTPVKFVRMGSSSHKL
ncbi:hypothetical protein M1116_01315 [Patescibacteria group bacterium]|nr:hypothetical protein [Patescibacteria group bacterium]